jgi:hypothetical protein
VNGTRSLHTLLLVSALVASLVAGAAQGQTPQGQKPGSVEPSAPVVIEVSDGFHWKDAGVGAVAALALVTIAVGLILVVRDGRDTPPAPRERDP